MQGSSILDRKVIAIQNKQKRINFLKKVEVKRVNDKITKKELCMLCKILPTHYNEYLKMQRVIPSKVQKKLDDYLMWGIPKVYSKIFEKRKTETKGVNHLNISEEDEIAIIKSMKLRTKW